MFADNIAKNVTLASKNSSRERMDRIGQMRWMSASRISTWILFASATVVLRLLPAVSLRAVGMNLVWTHVDTTSVSPLASQGRSCRCAGQFAEAPCVIFACGNKHAYQRNTTYRVRNFPCCENSKEFHTQLNSQSIALRTNYISKQIHSQSITFPNQIHSLTFPINYITSNQKDFETFSHQTHVQSKLIPNQLHIQPNTCPINCMSNQTRVQSNAFPMNYISNQTDFQSIHVPFNSSRAQINYTPNQTLKFLTLILFAGRQPLEGTGGWKRTPDV